MKAAGAFNGLPHPSVANVDLQPVAVMLQLVRPARATRRLRYDDRAAGMNEGGRSTPRTHAIHEAQTELEWGSKKGGRWIG
jgi:hypothetical protein